MNSKLKKIHSQALQRFDAASMAEEDQRRQCIEDRRFATIAGAQWEGRFEESYKNRLKFEVNKIQMAIVRITNQWRNNRISVEFTDKDGVESALADTCASLFRADEKFSGAQEAYDTAFDEGLSGGIGAFRLSTCYLNESDPEDERQKIIFGAIPDADGRVYFDPSAKRQDKTDAKWCFIIEPMSPDAYKDEYGDDIQSFNKAELGIQHDWYQPGVVYMAEYYVKEEETSAVLIYETAAGERERYDEGLFEDNPELMNELEAVGSRFVSSKKIKTQRVRKYILSGSEIKEDCGTIAGEYLPIIPFYGKRWYIQNIERYCGHVRPAKDAQRLKNMQISELGELSITSKREKPILTAEQIDGLSHYWEDDVEKDYPYLLVNPVTDANGNSTSVGPIGYTKPPQIPPALAALLQVSESDMQDILGRQQEGEKMLSNVSGKAMGLVQEALDMQSYIYISNFAKSMQLCGTIWLSMAKDVYVEEGRKLRTVAESGEVDFVQLKTPGMTKGQEVTENDLSEASFDVYAEAGPSHRTKKQATVTALTEMLSRISDPEEGKVLSSLILMNMEGEGLKDARKYYRGKLIKMGVIDATTDELEQMAEEAANTPPDANAEYLKAAAASEQAKTAKYLADAEKSAASADEIRAKAATEELEALQLAQELELQRNRVKIEAIEGL